MFDAQQKWVKFAKSVDCLVKNWEGSLEINSLKTPFFFFTRCKLHQLGIEIEATVYLLVYKLHMVTYYKK